MTPENFCYWLQGYFELRCEVGLTNDQADCIREHLELVFKKETKPKGLKQVVIQPTPSLECNNYDWFKNCEHPVSC